MSHTDILLYLQQKCVWFDPESWLWSFRTSHWITLESVKKASDFSPVSQLFLLIKISPLSSHNSIINFFSQFRPNETISSFTAAAFL